MISSAERSLSWARDFPVKTMQNTTRANKQPSRMRLRNNDKFKSLPLQRTIKTGTNPASTSA
jgi:hypothetical protein